MKRIINYKIIRLLAVILFTFSLNNAFAEEIIGVSGQVKDAETKNAIEFCSINIFNLKDSLISSTATNSKGFFSAALANGKYKLLVENFGYVSDTSLVMIKTGNEFLGVFKLLKDVSIEEVVIEGATKENLIDKEVFLVTKDLKTGAANTKDVLSKVNGLTYDRYNNSIKVDGEENIIILINGLEKDQKYIKNLAPDRLKKIEVIRDPSGKYALEGYSAVINVILKDNYKGFEIYSDARIISDIDNKNKDHLFPINSSYTNFNYTYNKVNLYAKYDYNYMNLLMLNTTEKEYENGQRISKGSENNNPNLDVKNIGDNLTVGADYYLNPKHTISIETNFSGLFFNENNTNSISNTKYFQDGVLFNELNSETKNKSTDNSGYYSAFYIGKLSKTNTININFTYSKYSSNYLNKYLEENVLQRNELGENNRTNTKFYAEFNHIINEKSGFEIGYGNTSKKLLNTFSSNSNNDNFEFTDFRNKIYAYYSWKLNKKFGVKIGGAAETSTPKSEELSTTYFIYQPYANIKYKPFKFLDIRIKYRSSSDYPSISEANPFTYIIDKETIQTGNPLLKPTVKHKISTRFQIMGGLATIEPYYNFSSNLISKTGMLKDDGIFENSFNNTGKYEHKGIKGNITIPFRKSLFLQTGANFFHSKIEYNNKINEFSDWKLNSQLIYVNKKTGTVTGLIFQNNMYKNITAQGYNKWNNDFWGLFLQQNFLKEKLNITMFYILPISLAVDYDQGSFIKTDTYSEQNITDMQILNNALMFQISYRFSKGESVHKTKKDIKIEKEKTTKKLF